MLVYGKESKLPISIEFPSLDLVCQLELEEYDPMIIRLEKLIELEEKRQQIMQTLETHQEHMKGYFDKKAKVRVLKEGDLVLKWDADRENLGRHLKFDALWSVPYVITSCK